MKPEWRRFAPLGLVLALLAALAAAGLYIVQREWNLALQISLGLIVVGLALFAFLDPDRVRVLLSGRQARYGSNALILTIAFVGILVVINYLVFQNTKRWDLTEDKEYTLAPETLETLKTLQGPVVAEAYYTQRMPADEAKKLLEQYQFNSQGKLTYQFIDPETDPVRAQAAKVTRDGTIVLKMGTQQEPVTAVSEAELTGALVRLINPEARTVYFLTGHGEYNPEDTGEQSYSQVKNTLESKNYTVKTLNLLADKKIPPDAKVVVVAGPRKPVSQEEVDLLIAYVDGGGGLFVLEDPLPVTDFGDAPDPLADYLSQKMGVVLGKDIVVDQTSNQPFVAYAAQYGNSPITQKMQRLTSVFPTARSTTINPIDGISLVQLVMTAPQSWAEKDLAGLKTANAQIKFDQGVDLPGPVPIAAVAENFEKKSRVAVFGDADFAADQTFPVYGNGDLFVNTVDWLAQQENLINLTPKKTTQRLVIPPQKYAMNLILLGSVFLVPGLVLLAGIMVWVQRRKRG